jgi:CSLREA domain-containing protein
MLTHLTCGARRAGPVVGRLALVVLAVATAVTGSALAASPALASSFVTVTTTSDENVVDGQCSLREAILYAQNLNGADTDCGTVATGTTTIIVPAGHYAVRPGSPDAHLQIGAGGPGPVVIEGAGAASTVIDAQGASPRLLLVGSGATVIIKDLTLRGGVEQGQPGGGIDNAGALTLDHVTVTANQTALVLGGPGGGIYNTGTLTLLGSTVSDNSTARGYYGWAVYAKYPCLSLPDPGGPGSDGGGLYNQGGTVTATNTTFTGNTTGAGGLGSQMANHPECGAGSDGGSGGHGGNGGAIFNNDGFVTLRQSAVYGNTTGGGGWGGTGTDGQVVGGFGGQGGEGGSGAGIANNGMLTVINTTIAGNTTGNGGIPGQGGLAVRTGIRAVSGLPGDGGHGAGIWQENGQSTVQESTVAANVTGAGGGRGGRNLQPTGGGIEVLAGELTEIDTIASNNDCYAGPGGQIKDGLSVGDGHLNLTYPTATCPGIVANPLLQPLHDNGGPTQTMAISPPSAALDRIPPTAAAGCTPTDQRGTPRPQPPGGRCDIGAFEAAP